LFVKQALLSSKHRPSSRWRTVCLAIFVKLFIPILLKALELFIQTGFFCLNPLKLVEPNVILVSEIFSGFADAIKYAVTLFHEVPMQ